MNRFVWTVAYNTLSNYYRDSAKSMVGVSIDEVAELIADPYSEIDSGDRLMDKSISFEEVATIRPDGSHNICHADVVPDEMVLPEDYVYMKNWCGPIWNGNGERILWQIDTEGWLNVVI